MASRGYTRGINYWEVKTIDCASSSYNSYVGVAVNKLDKGWFLGADPCNNFIFFLEFLYFYFYLFFILIIFLYFLILLYFNFILI